MALEIVPQKTGRSPADPLAPMHQEEVYFLIERARAIAFLMESDGCGDGKTLRHAAGAIAETLTTAMSIMETGASDE